MYWWLLLKSQWLMAGFVVHGHIYIYIYILYLHEERHSLGEVGKVLSHFGDKRKCPGGAVVWIFLHEAEEWGWHDGRTQEAQEKRCADQAFADIRSSSVTALLPPGCKHFLELPRKHAGVETQQNELTRKYQSEHHIFITAYRSGTTWVNDDFKPVSWNLV